MGEFKGMTDRESIAHQLKKWVEGTPLHNTVRNECCPDFSCCGSEIMPIEIRKKFAKAVGARDEKTQWEILSMALSGLCVKKSVRAYVSSDGKQTETQGENMPNPCGNPKCNEINVGIDKCIKPLIEALNNAGLKTIASCCGHGNSPGNVALADGREIIIVPDYETARRIEKMFPDIHGNRAEYPAQEPDTWIKPTMKGYRMQCYDCGLIHEIDFQVVEVLEKKPNGDKELCLADEKYEVEIMARRIDE